MQRQQLNFLPTAMSLCCQGFGAALFPSSTATQAAAALETKADRLSRQILRAGAWELGRERMRGFVGGSLHHSHVITTP